MLSSQTLRHIAVIACIAAIPTLATAQTHKVRVQDPAEAARLVAAGARLVADYGAFQVLETAAAPSTLAVGNSTAENIDEQNYILLNAGRIDTRVAVEAARTKTAVSTGNRLHLVQFAGPVKPEWLAELTNSGVRIVTYIPHNAYLVYGPDAGVAAVKTLKAAKSWVQYEGSYLDDDKIQPRAKLFDAIGQPVLYSTNTYAVQMVEDAEANATTLATIDSLKLAPIFRQDRVQGYVNVIATLPVDAVVTLAARPDVVSVNLYVKPKKMDERQDQIVAGNLTGLVPSGPGYLTWLATKGFTQEQFAASGFLVDLCDSGLDIGTNKPNHFGLYTSGNTGLASRVVYNRLEGTANSGSTLQGCDGHGNLNGHIIAGYVGMTNSPHTDSAGYRYGLGVCPFVKLGSSVIFDPGTFTTPSYPDMLSRAYRDGARISSDSWGADTAGDYDVDAQSYDALVRDAQPTGAAVATAGNQEITIVFAAGNAGSSAQTVGSPGTAKNVITVGAAENVHSHATTNGGANAAGNDGCSTPDTEANSAGDIASFSSRGPCSDSRAKPDIVAPGTHITGGVAQQVRTMSGTGSAISCFDGTGVCGLPGGGTAGSSSNFFPLGQQFYSTSSGTSHSTPAVAGGCALVRQYFINRGVNAPSPAMTKAFLMNSARYMTGTSANDSLWSNNQGMGGMNLGTAFDGVARVMRDELTNDLFTATGQSHVYPCTIADGSKPVRITLAWTDAPGATSGNAYKNNLDLTLSIGGTVYRGNVFSGSNSVAGGTADARNNAESIFLPAGTTGAVYVTVTAANINSDGVPNYGGTLDQDFALVAYNVTEGVSNQPPVFAALGDKSGSVSNLLQFTVAATDVADGDVVTLSASNVPSWATFASITNAGGATNVFSGTPYTSGTFAVTFFASDKDGTASQLVNIYVGTGGGVATNLIDEPFNGGTTAPTGWTITGLSTYTSVGNYGRGSPSLKFDSSGDQVLTTTFANGTNLSFWIKGQTTDSSSALLVEGLTGASWGTITNIVPLPISSTVVSRAISPAITRLRFTYTKSVGNLSFDDVIVGGLADGGSAPVTTPPVFNAVPNQFVQVSNTLTFTVSAQQTDGDTVTLSASNLPPGAVFSSLNENGSVTWSNAAPVGVYTSRYYAADKDGIVSITNTITVTASGGGSTNIGTNVLVYFDFETAAGPFESTADTVAANLTAAPVTTADGTYTNFGGNPTRAVSDTGFNNGTNYFEFGLVVATGCLMNVSGYSFHDRTSGTGPTEWHLKYNGDAYATDLALGSTHASFTTNAGGLTLASLAGTNVFRVYGAGASSAGGTWRLDNFTLLGSVNSAAPNPDSDGDGIPDAWELVYSGSLTNMDATTDTDKDGFSDLNEFLAGTDATNDHSLLAATTVAGQSSGDVLVYWQSASGRVYTVERVTDLFASFAGIASNLPATPTVNVYTDSVPTNGAGYYRIRLQ